VKNEKKSRMDLIPFPERFWKEAILIRNVFISLVAVLVIIGAGSPQHADAENDDWALTLYGGRLSLNNLGETLTFQAEYEDSYFGVLALSKRFGTFWKYIDFEIEGQVAHHFGDQDHLETNGLAVFRWQPFFWDAFVDTSVAAGGGISYAFEIPELEAIGHPDTPKLLGYLMFEFEFAGSEDSKWAAVVRIHHRSGADGLVSGRLDASNGWCLGVKYRF
jgi:hypothetical protein